MDAQQTQILEQQKQTWNRFAPGWRKWDTFTMDFLRPMGNAIIDTLKPEAGQKILDIATGTGEPGLTLAEMVKPGSVIGIDISEGMLQVAKENAAKRGVQNYTTQLCDVSSLPFENESFDAVSCRMGFMFFPDMKQAAQEMARVLKQGGNVATSVWGGAEKNPWVTATMQAISKTITLTPPSPGAPGMFRCAAPGLIAGLFKDAGLKNSTEKEITGTLQYDNAEHYWSNMTEIAAPVAMAMSQATDEQKEQIKKDLFALLQSYTSNGAITLPFSAIMISAQK